MAQRWQPRGALCGAFARCQMGHDYGEVERLDDEVLTEAAHDFSRAADLLVDALRRLESCGLDDPPSDRLMRALDDVTHMVHQMHPPDERIKFEAADIAPMVCRIAGRRAHARVKANVPSPGELPNDIPNFPQVH
jgi:hypothetical protein